jgi:hypothetical protein
VTGNADQYATLRLSLLADDSVEHGMGATDTEVIEAVGRIGVLPADFQAFLREFGWIAVMHYEIFGLGADVPAHQDLVAMTHDERVNYGLPSHLTPIMNDGGGNLYCFDSRATGDAVWLWDHEASPRSGLSRAGDSFVEWLLRLIEHEG